MTKARSTALSARSNDLDDIDGSPERRVYTQMRRIEQVRVWRGFQGSGSAPGIAFIAAQQVGQNLVLVGGFAPCAQLKHPPCRTHFGAGDDEELYVGARRDDGADIAAVEHRAGRLGR